MSQGFIKLHRQITEWEWYSDTPTRSVFIDLLLNASHNEYKWHGLVIKRGQVIFGYPSCSERIGISIQSIRTAIKHLKSTGELTVKITNKFSVVTLANYDKYQDRELESTGKSTGKLTVNQQATNRQLTTTKNVKNDKNEKNNSYDLFLEKFNELTGRKFKILDGKTNNQIKNLLENGYTIDDWVTTIMNSLKDKYITGSNEIGKYYLTPEFISRPQKFEQYLCQSVPKTKQKYEGLNNNQIILEKMKEELANKKKF